MMYAYLMLSAAHGATPSWSKQVNVKCRLTFNAMVYSKVNAKIQEKTEEMIADAMPRYIDGEFNKKAIALIEWSKKTACDEVWDWVRPVCIAPFDSQIAARKDPVNMRAKFDSIPAETVLLMMGQLDAPAQRVECLDDEDTFQPCTDLFGETVCEQVALYERDGKSKCEPTGDDAGKGAFALKCDMKKANSTQAMTEYHDGDKNPECLERQEVAKGMKKAKYNVSTGKWELDGTEVQTVCAKTPLIKVLVENVSALGSNDLVTQLIPSVASSHPTTAKMFNMVAPWITKAGVLYGKYQLKYLLDPNGTKQELVEDTIMNTLNTLKGKNKAQIAQATNEAIAMKKAAHDLFNDISDGNGVAGLLESFLSVEDVEEVANAIRASPQFDKSAWNHPTLLSLFGNLKQALKAKATARLLL